MIKTYAKGRRWEYKVRNDLKEKGYYVVRSAKSSFPDLIAINNNFVSDILWVECKVMEKYLSKKEKIEILKIKKKYGGVPLVAFKQKVGRKVVPQYKLIQMEE